jgi:hypothetical protein
MGFGKNSNYDWLKNFSKSDDCSETKDNCSTFSSNDSNCSDKSGSTGNEKCETIKDECRKGSEKCVVDKRQKVIREKISKVRHIKKIYIQPIHRIQHEKKTIVYRLPTICRDEGCKKDCGVKYVKVNRRKSDKCDNKKKGSDKSED